MTGTRDWKPQWGQRTYASPRAILVYPFSHEPVRGPKKLLAESFLVAPGKQIGPQNNLGMTFGWSLQGLANFPEGDA